MPVRSLTSPVLIWPNRDRVDEAVRCWGVALKASTPAAVRVGYFGSYARGNWGVGSDLDVVVIIRGQHETVLIHEHILGRHQRGT